MKRAPSSLRLSKDGGATFCCGVALRARARINARSRRWELDSISRCLDPMRFILLVLVLIGCGRGERSSDPPRPYDAKISGHIFHNGKPLANARIVSPLVGHYQPPSPSTTSNADGSFELNLWARGRMLIEVKHSTGLETSRYVDVTEGQHVKDVSIEVGASGTIQGVVVDVSGKPLDKATVWVTARDTAVRRYAYGGGFAIRAEVGHTYVEVRLDDEHPNANGLRVVIGGRRELRGVAVDENGVGIKDAMVIASEPTFVTLSNGNSRSKGAWIPKGVATRSATSLVGSSLYAIDQKTDASGQFTWSPIGPGPYSVLVLSSDGRVGASDNITVADSPLRISLRPAGSIKIVCKNFRPMGGTLEDMNGGVDIVVGKRRYDVGCGETVGDMPEGRYLVSSKADAFKYASVEVDVKAGTTATALLEVQPIAAIHGTLLSHLDEKPLADFECDAGIFDGDRLVEGDPGATTNADGKFDLKISRGRVVVTCRDRRGFFADGVADLDLTSDASVTVRTVKQAPSPVDMGVEFEAKPEGARVLRATKAAGTAGLKPGDIVRSVDGGTLAGLGMRAMRALAFEVPAGKSVRWTVDRDGKPIELTALAQ
jgi:hypothetical protein